MTEMIPATNDTRRFARDEVFSFSRTTTFESAVERVHQLCEHLSRSNTMAANAAVQNATQNVDDDVSTPNPEPTQEDAPEKLTVSCCKFCKRPSDCPSCHKPLVPEQQKSDGTVDIDAEIQDIHNQLGPLPATLPPKNPVFQDYMPPGPIKPAPYSVFLAGSIEMGRAVQWQRRLTSLLQHLPLAVYNPRRGHWNPNATPEAKNAEFRAQVTWELGALEEATVICFFFDHDTMSPVTMCELGLWVTSGKVVVCCDKKFWKSGNVHIVCEKFGVPLVESFDKLVELTTAMLREKGMRVGEDGGLLGDGVEGVEMEGWAADPDVLKKAILPIGGVKHEEVETGV
ncbi:hypothetical protein CC80DRAFT_486410 [Byssothecium circinans]|uniref:Nucleoside 2-deoxyribosyltransferase domain-containing protein n=1 Tax=Byssothecium circinans TaxID=147558 RepID=A0A6A5T7V9_9PLEO|nr:hypothetical protein CC80DRAFT_486410 [Byssothecium circinans]